METIVRDLEVAFFLRPILPDLMTYVAKIYQIGLFIIWRRVFYWELNHSYNPYGTSSGTRVRIFRMSPL